MLQYNILSSLTQHVAKVCLQKLMGESYKCDAVNATVCSVKLRRGQADLAMTARFGTQSPKSVLALLHQSGHADFRAKADGSAATTNQFIKHESMVMPATSLML
ncbi:hypothetical protein EBQ91_04025 [bacterium]|nr:hypothetical protein [bacterium]